jgi:hypothetical protein
VKPDRVRKYKAGAGEKQLEMRIFGPFLGFVVLMPSQRRHTPRTGVNAPAIHLEA